LLFQELDHFPDLVADLGDAFEGRFAAKRPSACLRFAPPLEDGVSIFIRKSLLRFTHAYDEQRDVLQFQNANQVALLAEVSFQESANDTVDIVLGVTHLRATKTAEGEVVRRNQSIELRKYLEKRSHVAVDGPSEAGDEGEASNILTDLSAVKTNRYAPVILGVDLNALPSIHARPTEVNEQIALGKWPAAPEYESEAYAAMVLGYETDELDTQTSIEGGETVTAKIDTADACEASESEYNGEQKAHNPLISLLLLGLISSIICNMYLPTLLF
jgi:hypothetical protein